MLFQIHLTEFQSSASLVLLCSLLQSLTITLNGFLPAIKLPSELISSIIIFFFSRTLLAHFVALLQTLFSFR